MSEGAGAAANTGTAASSASSAGSGMASGAMDAGTMGSTAGNVAEGAANTGSWYQPIVNAVSDYSKGAGGSLGDAVKSYQGGNYMQTAGYLGNKIQGMNPGNTPTPLIQLPNNQPQQPQDRYAQLYARYRSQYA